MSHLNILRFILGWFLFLFGLVAMQYSIYISAPGWALWFCYIGMVLLGVGGLLGNKRLVVSQLYILILPNTVWLIDFFYRTLVGRSLWQVTDYLVDPLAPFSFLISLSHFIILPVGIILVVLTPGRISFAWLVSFTQIFIIYLLGIYLTPAYQNVNCLFKPCASFMKNIHPYYLWWWVAALFSLLVGFIVYNLVALTIKYLYYDKKLIN